MKNKLITVLILTIITGYQSVSAPDNSRARRILEQVDRNMNFQSSIALQKLVNIEPSGNRKEFIIRSFKKGKDKRAILFLSPSADKGRATLRLGENIWLYIPSAGRPIRIAGLQSITGGVFNNSDLLRLDFSTEYDAVITKEVPGKIILNLKAKVQSVAYDRMIMHVNPQYIIPEVLECYSASNMLIKTLQFSALKNYGRGLIGYSQLSTTSPLQKGYQSVIITGSITPAELPDDMFTLNYLSLLSTRGR